MRPLELSALWNRAECMSRAPCCWDLIKRVTAVAGQVCSADAWHDTREGTNGAAELPAAIVLHGYGVFSPMIPYAWGTRQEECSLLYTSRARRHTVGSGCQCIFYALACGPTEAHPWRAPQMCMSG